MDMNTIREHVITTDPDMFRPGDAWLAGGTVLFSYGSSKLQRLLDITKNCWTPIIATEQGLELAATCTISQLYDFEDVQADVASSWPAVELIRKTCDSFVASFKIWNVSTVGGNICTALPAGPIISLTAGLDAVALILAPGGTSRRLPVAELVTGDGTTALAPGEMLRSIHIPAAALESTTAFRRLSLSNLGRSGVLLIGRHLAGNAFVLTITASTKRPVQLRFPSIPDAGVLVQTLTELIPDGLYHDDIHGDQRWRRDMTYLLAEEIRAELEREARQR